MRAPLKFITILVLLILPSAAFAVTEGPELELRQQSWIETPLFLCLYACAGVLVLCGWDGFSGLGKFLTFIGFPVHVIGGLCLAQFSQKGVAGVAQFIAKALVVIAIIAFFIYMNASM